VRRLRLQGLPALAGLTELHLLRGIKGAPRGRFAALWVYESRQAWDRLWSPPDQPLPPTGFLSSWRAWEEGLRPFLDAEPDRIAFTVYEEVVGG
jgi:hypothetical protein